MHPETPMFSRRPAKQKFWTYRVRLRHEANDLEGMVEVISTGPSAAGRLAKREFFRNGSWKVIDARRVDD